MKNDLTVIKEYELEEVNGGISLLACGLIVGLTLIGDHILEQQTGKDAVQWGGTALSAAGKMLQNVGEALMN